MRRIRFHLLFPSSPSPIGRMPKIHPYYDLFKAKLINHKNVVYKVIQNRHGSSVVCSGVFVWFFKIKCDHPLILWGPKKEIYYQKPKILGIPFIIDCLNMIILVFFAPNQRTWKQTGNNNNRKNNKNKLKNKFIFGTLGFEAILSNCSMKINLQSVKEHNSILTSCVCSFFFFRNFQCPGVRRMTERVSVCRHGSYPHKNYSYRLFIYQQGVPKQNNKKTQRSKTLFMHLLFWLCHRDAHAFFKYTTTTRFFYFILYCAFYDFKTVEQQKKHKSKLALQISKKPMKKKDGPGPNWEWNLMYFG